MNSEHLVRTAPLRIVAYPVLDGAIVAGPLLDAESKKRAPLAGTQQPVNLSMRQGDEIIYVERAFSERSGMQVVRAIGGRAPLHLTSVGKLFLAADDPQRVRSYATRTGLQGHTKNSITELSNLERELSKVRQYGQANDNEELELGVRCMAAGIYDDQEKLVAGLSISAPSGRMDDHWLPKLKETAREISQALGYTGG